MRQTARSWRRTLAAVVAALAVLASLIVGGPAAPAAAQRAEDAAGSQLASLSPTPQIVRPRPHDVVVTPVVGVVTGQATDRSAVEVAEAALRAAGARDLVRASDQGPDPRTPLTVWVGGPTENRASAGALAALEVAGPEGLRAEGYVLAAGRDRWSRSRVVLAGVDAAGTFYAAQTLRQLLATTARVPGVEIRDWPEMRVRGGMESFFGPQWSHQDRVRHLEFLGRNKLNTFLYCPFGDPRTHRDWRLPYPPDELERFRSLVELARRNHVDFIYRVNPEAPLAPEFGICHAADDEFELLVARLEQLWDVGVRSFVIGFDDVGGQLQCELDRRRFGADRSPLAAAQAYLLNRLQREFVPRHPGISRLGAIPTEYWGTGHSTYRDRLAELVDPEIIIHWTGPEVISPTITAEHARQTAEVYNHDLQIFDNYPVNDYTRNRLLLGPVVGREPALTERVLGINANLMNEAEASKIPLYTIADFTWNPDAYNPERSWDRSLRDFGGPAYEALRTFAENSRSSPLDSRESLELAALVERFQAAYGPGGDLAGASLHLLRELEAIRSAPDLLRARLGNPRFLEQAAPYLDKLELYGKAGEEAVRMLLAQRAGQMQTSWRHRLALEEAAAAAAAIPQVMATRYPATRIFEPFFAWAREANDPFLGLVRVFEPKSIRWTPVEYDEIEVSGAPPAAAGSSLALAADGKADTAYRAARAPRAGEALTVALPEAHELDRIVVLQDADRPVRAAVEGRGADGVWRRLGTLRAGVSTIDADKRSADAIRLVWPGGGTPPQVHEVLPVYADALPVRISISPSTVLAVAGREAHLEVTLDALTEQALEGTLRVVAPEGWGVTPTTQPFRLAGDAQRLTVDVAVPADAANGTVTLRFVAETPDGLRARNDLVTQVVAAGSYPALVVADGPIGYWRLGETSGARAFDASGHGNDGTYRGAVALGRQGALAGDPDTAAEFAGGYAEVPDSPTVSVTGPFTLEAWMRTGQIGSQQSIVEKYDVPAPNGYALRLLPSGRLAAYTLGPAGSIGSVESRTALSAGVWYHLAAVYDGAALRIYVNGALDASAATTIDPTDGPMTLKIGARGDDAGTRFDGLIDEVAIYDRALSQEQLAAHVARASSAR